jgi:hypothetical protein
MEVSHTTRRARVRGQPPESEPTDEQRKHLEELLDAALEATFPASDPLAFASPHRRPD